MNGEQFFQAGTEYKSDWAFLTGSEKQGIKINFFFSQSSDISHNSQQQLCEYLF